MSALWDWIKDNKALTAVLAFFVLVPLGFIAMVIPSSSQAPTQSFAASDDMADMRRGSPTESGSDGGSYVEVKEGDMEITSQDMESDAETIRGLAESRGGYIERRSKTISDFHNEISMTARLPSAGDNFTAFVDRVKEDFEVSSYNVRNFRLSTQREQDEITIINTALSDYDQIREDIKRTETTAEKLELLMQVTDKKLDLQQQKKEYERDLSDIRQRSDYATLRITIKEDKSVEVLPDNLGNRFKQNVQDMIDSVTTILMDIVTHSITIFFQVVKLFIYAFIAIIPIGLALKLGITLYRRYW